VAPGDGERLIPTILQRIYGAVRSRMPWRSQPALKGPCIIFTAVILPVSRPVALVFIAFHPARPVPAGTILPIATAEQGYETRLSARLRPVRLLTLFVCYATMRPKLRCLRSLLSRYTAIRVFLCDVPRSTSPPSIGGLSAAWLGEFF